MRIFGSRTKRHEGLFRRIRRDPRGEFTFHRLSHSTIERDISAAGNYRARNVTISVPPLNRARR
ncbi:protein of unknown function [Hyphomicrobium sp. MC1]|nr:protein of unknown function [Hyphomicrobium sp. MC1]